MVDFSDSLSKIFNIIPGPIFGIFSVTIGLLGDFLALLFFPKYNLDLMISKLGIGPGGIFFNIGTILSGFFAFLFYLYLGRVVKDDQTNENLRKAAIVSASVSCFFFMLLGVFPSVEGNQVLIILHGNFASICFITGLIYFLLFNIMILRSKNFLKIHAYVGFTEACLILTFLFTWNPISEWIMTIGIIVWIMLLAIYLFYRKTD
ncbi:MAG: DUF998 domain-containing protein [Candidatus Hodarchaeota archaeon]